MSVASFPPYPSSFCDVKYHTTRHTITCAAADGAREEYIESELARRHHAIASPSSIAGPSRAPGLAVPLSSAFVSSQDPRSQDATTSDNTHLPSAVIAAPRPPEHPHRALQGQLTEVDLGDEARSRNEALTERATRRFLHGSAVAADEDEDSEGRGANSGRPKKVRLGRDGKPWRPRNNRRTSDDVRRDQLVEEILRENRRKPLPSSCLNEDMRIW